MIQFKHHGRLLGQHSRQQTDCRLALRFLAYADHAPGDDRAGNGSTGKSTNDCASHGVCLVAKMIGRGHDDERRHQAAQVELDVICRHVDRCVGIGVMR
jgi:hypothetical protein